MKASDLFGNNKVISGLTASVLLAASLMLAVHFHHSEQSLNKCQICLSLCAYGLDPEPDVPTVDLPIIAFVTNLEISISSFLIEYTGQSRSPPLYFPIVSQV